MLVSFHPRVEGDANFRLTPTRRLTSEEIHTIDSAQAVIVTQHIKAWQYATLKRHCPVIFPNYDHRFGFEGKCGNVVLFRRFDAPHPKTWLYESVTAFRALHFQGQEPLGPFPLVLKGDRGGGGWAIFCAKNRDELTRHLEILGDSRLHPTKRFVVQAFVPHGGSDLRVVVIGKTIKTYWRCQHRPGEIRNNVGRGATIAHHLSPELTKKGIGCVQHFCEKTGINLAAFDVLFDRSRPDPQPLLSEINFLFGRKGLGGSPAFHRLLNQAVQGWISDLSRRQAS